MAKYTNDHFNKFIPEEDLTESILVENPVHVNLHPPRIKDELTRDLLIEKRAGRLEVAAYSNVVKLQQKLLDVMGPSSQGLNQSKSPEILVSSKWKSHYLKF